MAGAARRLPGLRARRAGRAARDGGAGALCVRLPTSAEGAEVGDRVAGESHAWIEVWTGDWWGFDPTNNQEIGHRHIGVARGRDYADVAPLRGVHSGGGGASLDVEVSLTRLR